MTEPSAAGGETSDVERIRSRVLRRIGDREVYFDSEGFFWEPDDWTEAAAGELARESGIADLSDVQWRVLRYLRAFYLYHGRAPMNRELRSGTGVALAELERSFPGGIKQGARRLAGLPNPRTCLD